MKRKEEENIEHRGNANKVADRLQLEMEMLKNVNRDKQVYTFNNNDKPDKKKVDFK